MVSGSSFLCVAVRRRRPTAIPTHPYGEGRGCLRERGDAQKRGRNDCERFGDADEDMFCVGVTTIFVLTCVACVLLLLCCVVSLNVAEHRRKG